MRIDGLWTDGKKLLPFCIQGVIVNRNQAMTSENLNHLTALNNYTLYSDKTDNSI